MKSSEFTKKKKKKVPSEANDNSKQNNEVLQGNKIPVSTADQTPKPSGTQG